jgi:hypothetical protein
MKTAVIKRHVAVTEHYRNSLAYEAERLETMLGEARLAPGKLNWVYSHGMATAQLSSVVDVRSPLVPRAIALAAEAIVSNFRLHRGGGRIKKIQLGGKPITYASAKPERTYLTPGDWLKGFCLAMICRDVKLIDELCFISGDDLRKLNPASAEFRFLLIDGIRQTWQGADADDTLVAAMEATDPKREDMQSGANFARVKALEVPLIQLVWYVASGDADFQKVLVAAVRSHQKFWTATPQRERSWHGFMSLELTALAAWYLDWDRGALAIDSDYVPNYLYRGEFLE